MPKKRGLSSVDARIIRQRGHTNALEFALSIGLTRDYRNDLRAKKSGKISKKIPPRSR